MKCKYCDTEWTPRDGSRLCPHCGKDNSVPQEELDNLVRDASAALQEKNYEKAVILFKEAMDRGDVYSEYKYATMLLEGKGVRQSSIKAAVHLKVAARQGLGEASLLLSRVLSKMSVSESTCLFWVRVAAFQQNAEAARILAKRYEKGDGLPADIEKALDWYLRASMDGENEATVDLVRFYTEDGTELSKAHARFFLEKMRGHRILANLYQKKLGRGEAISPMPNNRKLGEEYCALGKEAEMQDETVLAMLLYRAAEELGCSEAIFSIGLCYEKGIGVKKDYGLAADCYRRSAEAGYSPAMTQLGLLIRDRNIGEESSENTLEWLERAAEAGEPDAEYALGCAYFDGTGTKRNLGKARYWFSMAATHGQKEAESRSKELDSAMEEVYRKAEAAKKAGHPEDAFRLFSIAADMGHREARCKLGFCYQVGMGTKRNAKKAVEYYTLSATQGNATAVFYLGNCYLHGDGIKRDYQIAAKLLKEAEKAGFHEATNLLTQMDKTKQKKAAKKLYSTSTVIYHRGDVESAIRFRVISAGMGNPKAMFLLGCHYEFGEGLPYDPQAADQWYRKSVSAGFQVGASRLKNGFTRERKHRLAPKKK